MAENTAVTVAAYNKINDGGLVVTNLPIPTPGEKEVRLRVLLRPVNPADIACVQGFYPAFSPASLPAVPGLEGVGVVDAIGSGVTKFKVGQRVVPFLFDLPRSWQTYLLVHEDNATVVPDNVSNESACQFVVNPFSAWGMIFGILDLQPGQYLLQSAAGSALGRQVIALCKKAGVKTINIVRRAEQIDSLKAIGADHVLLQSDENLVENIKALTPGGAGVSGAIDAVAGDLTSKLMGALAPGKTILVYGAMGGLAFNVSIVDVVFKSNVVRGFWLGVWYSAASPETKSRMIKELWEAFSLPGFGDHVGTKYPLSKIVEAIAESTKEGRGGKVLLE